MPDNITDQRPHHIYPVEQDEPVRKRGWLGVGLIIGFLVLVGGGVFAAFALGVFSDGRQFNILSEQRNAVALMRPVERLGAITSEPEFSISVDPQLPGEDFAVNLSAVSIADFAAGSTGVVAWIPRARDRLLPYLIPQTQLYIIESRGTPPETVVLTFNLEQPAQDRDLLDVYGWDAEINQWRFLPFSLSANGQQIIVRSSHVPDGVAVFRAEQPEPAVITRLNTGQTLNTEVRSLVTVVAPLGMRPRVPDASGQTLEGNPASGFTVGAGYRVLPVIRNHETFYTADIDTVLTLLNDNIVRENHIRQIVTFVVAGNYGGVFIDYRDLPDDQRDIFSTFIAELNAALSVTGSRLGVVVPQPQIVEGRWETGAYDWREIGRMVDYLQVEIGLDPTLFAPGPDRFAEALLRWAVGEVERHKIIVSLPALSVIERGGGFERIGYSEALANLGRVVLDAAGGPIRSGSAFRIHLDGLDALPGVDEVVQTPFVDYFRTDGSLLSRMWLTTPRALRFRLEQLASIGVGGVAFNDLLATDLADGLYAEVLSYRIQTPQAALPSENLQLRWRIADGENVLSEFITGFNDELVVTLDAPDGEYSFSVEVIDGERVGRQDSARVALAAPTATPTPPPFATQRPPATVTPTLIPVIPTEDPRTAAAAMMPIGVTPIAFTGGIAPPVGGGINLTGFEYGGHVMDMANPRAITAMQSAGMRWMKVQIRFTPGALTADANRQIQAARAAGFRPLIGLVGNARDMAAGGDEYIRQFAAFAGQIAALGPDAIEVWNEPNLSREWPSGQISGGNYTILLSQAYNAIKTANPNVIVISGAPAPTGAQAAFPGDVVNDDVFLREMVDAGALNYMDCLGVHYNEGVVPPTQTRGDPRGDDYYTRYLPTLIQRYDSITGGRKPMCITELGYLSPEGYGSLPMAFAWASGMDNARHAAYLAEAINYSARTGRVAMVIVWNVDFTRYDSDPMAGYAIIRPDGSCPACAAIAGSR